MRIVFLVIMAMLIQHCHAQTWTDERTGYAWTYVIENDTAIIRNGEYMYSAREAISPRPTGSVRIPATLGGCPVVEAGHQAFRDLNEAILDDRRMVVLLDEISWMGSFDKNFPGLLKIAWDNLFHRHPNLILFLCGSVSSWIRENILENAGFLGRPSADIVLRELPVRDCLAFWGGAGKRLSSRELIDMLSVTGGVPRYLEEINPSLSVDESLRQSCFSPSGYLFKDFDLMFDELYDDSARERKEVLKVLAERPMTVSEIAGALGRAKNGHVADLVCFGGGIV